MKNIILTSIIACLLLPNFAFAQNLPETTGEMKEFGQNMLQQTEERLPGMIQQMWKENVLPIWTKMWNWLVSHINAKIMSWLNPEIKKRKEIFQENFPGEKEKMQQEVKKEGSSLWQKFKELIK